jgi:hypothetical protein
LAGSASTTANTSSMRTPSENESLLRWSLEAADELGEDVLSSGAMPFSYRKACELSRKDWLMQSNLGPMLRLF